MAGVGSGRGSMAKARGKVLLGESDSEDEGALNINENYAERYNRWRGKEELQKCKSIDLKYVILPRVHCYC
jgi:hypothetical protein